MMIRFFKRCCILILFVAIVLSVFGFSFSRNVSVQRPSSAPANGYPELPWQLTLVNQENGLPESHRFSLKTVADGQQVDKRIVSSLKALLADAAAQGYDIHINSGYRTSKEQQQLYEEKLQTFLASGYDETTAAGLTQQWVSPAGTSEHELGLAVDIGTATPDLYDWLLANSWRYGFIQRYPDDKTSITGVAHEPWHLRYVGQDAAAAIYAQGLCLEEYVARLGG